MAWPSNSDYPQLQKAVGVKLEDLKSEEEHKLHRRVPFLLAPKAGFGGEERFCLFDVLHGKSVAEFNFRMGDWKCEGCSHGWLILLCGYKVILYNIFSGKLMHFPPLETSMSEYHYPVTLKLMFSGRMNEIFRRPQRKAVLSADPDGKKNDFIIMMKHYSYTDHTDHNNGIKQMIVFIRSRDKDWTYIELEVEDIICVNGLFYLLDRYGMLFSCEVKSDGCYKVRQIPSHSLINPSLVESPSESYLVESPKGDLLRVIKRYKNYFMVYKLVHIDSRNAIWEEVMNMGDVALFLGESHSISVVASDFIGCRSNSIYYAEHIMHFRIQHLRTPPKVVGPQPSFGHFYEGSELSKYLLFGGSAFLLSLNDKTIKALYPRCQPKICQPLLWISPNIV